MSTNNAPGEVENNINFDSPNIDPADLEPEQEEMTEEQKIQKQRETVDIDGTPLSEEEIAFKASDIKKKGRMNYFVNVEGAEERARAAARKEAADKAATERAARNAEAVAEKERRAEEDEANKKLIEEKRRTEEVEKYLKHQKDKQKIIDKKDRLEKTRVERTKRRNKIIKITSIVATIVIVIAVVAGTIISQIEKNEIARKEEEAEAANSEAIMGDPYTQFILKLNTDQNTINLFENYDFDSIDRLYDDFSYEVDDATKGRLYIDKTQRLMRYAPDEKDQILAAAKKAYVYSPEDMDVLQNLMSVYIYIGDTENAELTRIELNLATEKYFENYEGGEGEEYGY